MQLELMHETLADAIREVALLCGGSKSLACAIWPAKGPNEAHRHLLDCLNEDRPHKLSPDELIMIARLGRERGSDAVMRYLCAEAGYQSPIALHPDVERDKIRERIADGMAFIKANWQRLESLERSRG